MWLWRRKLCSFSKWWQLWFWWKQTRLSTVWISDSTQKNNLKLHERAVHERKMYKCTHCEYQATLKGNLVKHQQALHEGVKYQCNHCVYQSTTKSSLNKHQQSVHFGRKYPCNLCDCQATERGGLTKHPQSVHKEISLWHIWPPGNYKRELN